MHDELDTFPLVFKLPPQDLAALDFCAGNRPTDVHAWLDNLPLAQARIVSTHLYRALPAVARLKTTAANRLALLDCLWQPAHQCLTGLERDYLNQPLILPENARKTATLAQALQKHLSNGYLVTARQLIGEIALATEKNAGDEQRGQLTLALYRALASQAEFIVRSYQLYIPVAPSHWRELHLLYQLAEHEKLSHRPLSAEEVDGSPDNTIARLYGRVLLLATVQPNQLRQTEIRTLWSAFAPLAAYLALIRVENARPTHLFHVDLTGDRAPGYIPTHKTGTINWRQLDLDKINALVSDALAMRSGKKSQHDDNPLFTDRPLLSESLLQHLLSSWGTQAQRQSDRQTGDGTLQVTIGLTNLHYHLSNRTPFEVFLKQADKVDEQKEKQKTFKHRGVQLKDTLSVVANDPWEQAIDVKSLDLPDTSSIDDSIQQHVQRTYTGQHPLCTVPILDSSAGGYRLEWQGEIPGVVKAGELLGLRNDESKPWSVGVIRWVRQTPGATQIGVKILASRAIAAGVANIHKSGGFTEYHRALQLPALREQHQPTTLITNTISFNESAKIRIYAPSLAISLSHEPKKTWQLVRRIFSTGAVSQFTFRALASID